jgi:hypothetical protein
MADEQDIDNSASLSEALNRLYAYLYGDDAGLAASRANTKYTALETYNNKLTDGSNNRPGEEQVLAMNENTVNSVFTVIDNAEVRA